MTSTPRAEPVVPALDWIERDRREPDKVLLNVHSARRQVEEAIAFARERAYAEGVRDAREAMGG